jgi:hypothetical protein
MNTAFAAILVSILSTAGQAPGQSPAPPQAREASEPRGLVRTSERASPGYTLIAPIRSYGTWLVDLGGNVVHEWKSDATPGHAAQVLDDGHLLRAERVPSQVFHGGGQGGRVREFDWGGALVWEYVCADDGRLQHHDAKKLANGHVLLIAWERKTRDEAIAAGRDPAMLEAGEIWPDMVLEIEPTPPSGGKIVWEWHAWDHLVQDLDPARANHGDVAARRERIDLNYDRVRTVPIADEERDNEKLRALGYVGEDRRGPQPNGGSRRGDDWLHCNAVDYDAASDLVLLSVHNASELWVIDHSTTTEEARGSSGGKHKKGGDLLFRWGNPRVHRAGTAADQRLFGQHDVQWIRAGLPGAGHVLVFNNGGRGARNFSSVDELALPLGSSDGATATRVEIAWTYTSPSIFSGHISGAQRLANGNTLICCGETGRLVEVDAKGEVAWEYLNPFGGDAPMDDRFGPPNGRRGPPPDFEGPPDPPPEGRRDVRRDGAPRGPGMGGPGEQHALFRALRYPIDHPGIAQGLANAKSASSDR